MGQPLHVAFVWHMHQPYYRNASTGDFSLPWARLHATKDYLHMAEVLDDFPEVHATFNFVPSLTEQLQSYASGESIDRALQVSLKEQLSAADKEYLLSFFFSINRERVINRYPPYHALLQQRDEAGGDWRRFPDQYWTDLIVWFNLAWFDPGYVQRDAQLRALGEKGQRFSRADVRLVVEKSRSAAGPALDLYRRLQERGQIEISTSPYYHPILPLLVDGASALEAVPDLSLPSIVFAHPEDAIEQVRRALAAHETTFGQPARGMWPSEGSVSQAVADLLTRHTDLRWIATDEAILARSLGIHLDRDNQGHLTQPAVLYQPYALPAANGHDRPPLAIVFRDRLLSDRIGFAYQHMRSQEAADDLVQRLHVARERLGDSERPRLLSIILDGENCWEYYENNGDDFLRRLYARLSDDPLLKTVTVSAFLDAQQPQQAIERLAAGSWIGGDFLTWIGEPGQNRAWEYIARARERLVSRAAHERSTSLDVIGQAWRALYVAEGSDWLWWYSSRNNPNTDVFDVQFRGHLAEVYVNLGLPAPDWLSQPILIDRAAHKGRAPKGFIAPALTAAAQPAVSWGNAGYLPADTSTATMQRAESELRGLYYGYDHENLYLRLDLAPVGLPSAATVLISAPRGRANRSAPGSPGAATNTADLRGWTHALLINLPSGNAELQAADGYENWRAASNADMDIVCDSTVVELRLALAHLRLRLGDSVALVVTLGNSGAEERHPLTGHLGFPLQRFERNGGE